MKGIGTREYYLGADMRRSNKEVTLINFISAKTYIENVSTRIEKMFNCQLSNVNNRLP